MSVSSTSHLILSLSLISLFTSVVVSLKAGECEVCISVLDRFSQTLSKEQKNDPKAIEKEFVKFCKPLKTKVRLSTSGFISDCRSLLLKRQGNCIKTHKYT